MWVFAVSYTFIPPFPAPEVLESQTIPFSRNREICDLGPKGKFHRRSIFNFFLKPAKQDRSLPKCANQARSVKGMHFANPNELKNAEIGRVSGELWPFEVFLQKLVFLPMVAKG